MNTTSTGRWVASGVVGAVALLAVGFATSFYFTVDQGDRAVLLRNGAYAGTYGPGLHLKTPWVDSVRYVDVQTRTMRYPQLNSYSQDQQPADIAVSVTYRVDPAQADAVYARFGGVDALDTRLLTPHVSQEVKVVFGRYSAVRAIQDRARLNSEAFDAVKSSLAGDPEIVLLSLQIENIDFSKQYVQAIEARMNAEVEVQRIQQQLQQQEVTAKITVVQAQAAAEARVATARAEAQSIQLRGEAEASAIRVRAAALNDNPGLVQLQAVEKWNGVLPAQMVPGAALPFVRVGQP